MDADGDERPVLEVDEVDDGPGSGEVDGEDRPSRDSNGIKDVNDGVVDVDEESDADQEEAESSARSRGFKQVISHKLSNGHRIAPAEDDENEEDNVSTDEVDGDASPTADVYEIDGSDEEDDVVEDDSDADGEELDNAGDLRSTRRLVEIDAHEQGEDDDGVNDNGDSGEEDQEVEDAGLEVAEDEEIDRDAAHVAVQPTEHVEVDGGLSDMEEEPGNRAAVDHELNEGGGGVEEDEEDGDGEVQEVPPSHPTTFQKRERDDDDDGNVVVEDNHYGKLSNKKHHHF
ncbi:unnamed protein product [Cuscuta epithymum]|uniref:Uncharacterized protein n=1 Tax=Cuscuta epithymum TaxID=186058 RepID=A0AAV0E833_9ASTE|nr:unnamed protein product [Cuscuta epithymum]